MTSNDGTGDIKITEWVAEDGKRRVETVMEETGEKAITVNDGTELITYDETTNTAYRIGVTEDLKEFQDMSPKEKAEMMLDAIKDTHKMTLVGEEKVIGRDTYHLKAEAKDKDSLYGDQEIWVDKENWFILKTVANSGDIKCP